MASVSHLILSALMQAGSIAAAFADPHERTRRGSARVEGRRGNVGGAHLLCPPVQLGEVDSHVDGGVWGNNPAMVGRHRSGPLRREQPQ